MTASLFYRALASSCSDWRSACPARTPKDRPFDHDWRTGVTVAPGAMTWTDDNLAAQGSADPRHRHRARQDLHALRVPRLAAGIGRRQRHPSADAQELRGGRLHRRGKAGRPAHRHHLDRRQRRPRGADPVGQLFRLDDLYVVPHVRRAGTQRREVSLRRRAAGARPRRPARRAVADPARARAGRRQPQRGHRRRGPSKRAASKPTARRAANSTWPRSPTTTR